MKILRFQVQDENYASLLALVARLGGGLKICAPIENRATPVTHVLCTQFALPRSRCFAREVHKYGKAPRSQLFNHITALEAMHSLNDLCKASAAIMDYVNWLFHRTNIGAKKLSPIYGNCAFIISMSTQGVHTLGF